MRYAAWKCHVSAHLSRHNWLMLWFFYFFFLFVCAKSKRNRKTERNRSLFFCVRNVQCNDIRVIDRMRTELLYLHYIAMQLKLKPKMRSPIDECDSKAKKAATAQKSIKFTQIDRLNALLRLMDALSYHRQTFFSLHSLFACENVLIFALLKRKHEYRGTKFKYMSSAS